ncbi:hypothetical protein CN188_16215 [Sinorhizobium meliloti]|nr:hypothetical protein CN188_16215 [Sinorhizobium meliloti]
MRGTVEGRKGGVASAGRRYKRRRAVIMHGCGRRHITVQSIALTLLVSGEDAAQLPPAPPHPFSWFGTA